MSKLDPVSLISSRIRFQDGDAFSSTVVRISKISIALGIAVLVASVVIYAGFRTEIEQKMFSVGGQINLRQFTTGSLYEEQPLERNADFVTALKKRKDVSHIQSFAFKPALLRTETEVEGVILKGISADFNFKAFALNFEKKISKAPQEDELWLSKAMARKLGLKAGSGVILFFPQDPPRYRKMKVAQLFQTGLEDIDQNVVVVNQSLVQEMNEWKPDQVGGFEVFIKNFDHFESSLTGIESMLPYSIAAEPITETQIQLFDWLNIIGRNVLVMFILVALVSGFNMAATLLIMVMERRQMVGILKALGAGNSMVRKIFYRNGINIALHGIIWGNAIGLILALLQDQFHLIPLDPTNYYLDTVPIGWDWMSIAGINLGVLLITAIVILLPVRLVNRINPAEAVRAV